MAETTTMKKASDRSIAFLTDLVADREVQTGKTAAESQMALAKWLATPRSQKEVSALIDKALKAPKRPKPVTVFTSLISIPDSVPNSKFAISTSAVPGLPETWRRQEYLFFEVKKLRGRRVIRRLVGAPGDFSRRLLPVEAAEALLNAVSNPEFAVKSATLFGEIHDVCGVCAAPLTDDLSLERKIGPVCFARMAKWGAA